MLTFNFEYFLQVFPKLAEAVPYTVMVLVISSVLAFFVGCIVAGIRIAKTPILYQITEVWLSCVRSMPFVLLLFLVYFTMPVFLRAIGVDTDEIPKITYIYLTMIVTHAPVIGESLRPAYLAIDRGQHEAAMVFGLSDWHRITRIIIPQVIPIALPIQLNNIIEIIKDASLVYLLGIMDLMGRANLLINLQQGRGKLEAYLAVGILYWIVLGFLEWLAHRLEVHTSKKSGGNA